ncbi:competence/damage-inducible protein A [bacterium C-53]|nr:competence/damage-inducible protein A [Lachnospiraceae bacterium]NBI03989.1 competence/damage-inducible protein A [Lachnospiraceae bacterium]RKJ08926.1 competence/damage-inducible protein A [bacterium C-53]
MVVELISVGTEILLGNIVNTNAAYLSEQCALLGLSCFYQSVVGDNAERLRSTLELALKRADIVILSGGLGPTEDDLTKETAAEVLGKTLIMDEHWREALTTFFAKRNMKLTENNWKQAMVPEGCIVVDNKNGTAPGIIMEEKGKHVILLPGPPGEMIPMFEESMKPYLLKLNPGKIVSQMVKVCGIGESMAETMILDLIDQQTNPTIATYAKTGEVHLRVTAKADSEKEAKKLLKPMVKELKERFGAKIYSTNENASLESCVIDLLKENDLTLTTAESCTGGLFTARIVNVPGASEVLKEGFITYSNKAKRKYLGVKKSSLMKYGAVSERVAEEMARGACFFTKADVCVSITGIAGPDGETEGKPVGLVYIGCCICGRTTVREYRFSGERMKIRESSVAAALTLLRECLLGYFSEVTFGSGEKRSKKK